MIHRYFNIFVRIRSDILKRSHQCSPSVVQGWHDFATVITDCPVGIKQFDEYLAEIEQHVAKKYESASVTDEQKMSLERDLVINGVVPDVLKDAAERVTGSAYETLMEKLVDPSKVFFADDYWKWHSKSLGVTPDGLGRRYWIDIIKKTSLSNAKGTVRRCTRCASCTEDPVGKGPMTQWMSSVSKACICGGAWSIFELNEP